MLALPLAAAACLAGAPSSALGAPPDDTEPLARRVESPFTMAPSVTVTSWYSPVYNVPSGQPDPGATNVLLTRLVMPFATGPLFHYSRLSVQYVTNAPGGGRGLGDSDFFDALIFPTSWGGFGVGPGFWLPTATAGTTGDGVLAFGPSVGVLATPGRRWQLGVFHQTFFGVAGAAAGRGAWRSYTQPFLDVVLGERWVVGFSEMPIRVDWRPAHLARLPVGVRLTHVWPLGRFALRISVDAEHDFVESEVSPAWTFRLGAGLTLL